MPLPETVVLDATTRASRRTLTHAGAFRLVGLTLLTILAASSAPSPLYPVYAETLALGSAAITLVFAVYAAALLLALLVVGGLSDHVGRRPVLLGAVALEIVSLLVFAAAGDLGHLVLARVVQGLATGAFTGVTSAALVDLQAPGTQRGALVNSVGATLGLAVGALGSGLLVQVAPAPTVTVYLVLAAAFTVLLALLWRLPETAARRPGAWRSLVPRAAVPPAVRRQFLVVLPILVATWSMGGLFLSLGPTLAGEVLGLGGRLLPGLVVTAFAGSGALASVLTWSWDARRTMLVGAAGLALGTASTVVAVRLGDPLVFFPSEIVAGAGFGMAFLGAYQTVTALSEPERRAELLAAVFVVNYLAFSIPAVAAGVAVPTFGLATVAETYGGVVVVLALLLLTVETLRGRPRAGRGRDPA